MKSHQWQYYDGDDVIAIVFTAEIFIGLFF